MGGLCLLTRGYVCEVTPSVADIPAFPSVKPDPGGINVSVSGAPVSVVEARDENVNVKQSPDDTKVLPTDAGTIIKIKPC